ncbi:hypothetical protein [Alistipes sp.]|uniref:hypothetical protein n=1 Tax=Alistipes sp. TaxID=1872444 RepID=UPI0025BC11D6|nr:hypothetical protein [Alistipes sp.]
MEPYIENTARTLEHYLHRIGIRLDRLTLREYVDRHPMRHNLRCVSDLLDRFGIDHMACGLTWEQLLEIETPCLVQLRTIDDPIGEIVRTTPDTVVLRTPQGKKLRFSQEQFQPLWRGIVLAAEKTDRMRQRRRASYCVRRLLAKVRAGGRHKPHASTAGELPITNGRRLRLTQITNHC